MAAEVKLSHQQWCELRDRSGRFTNSSVAIRLGRNIVRNKHGYNHAIVANTYLVGELRKLITRSILPRFRNDSGIELVAMLRRHGWTVTKLAKSMGISRSAISKWLDGSSKTPRLYIECMGLLLDIECLHKDARECTNLDDFIHDRIG